MSSRVIGTRARARERWSSGRLFTLAGVQLSGPWQGEFVCVEPDGKTWSWITCVFCERPLTDPRSRARGFGPECAKTRSDVEFRMASARRLYFDRIRYRKRLDRERARAAIAQSLPPLAVSSSPITHGVPAR